MPVIHATFTDPDAVRRDHPDGVWFLLGTDNAKASGIESLVSTGDGATFCRMYPAALVVVVRPGAGEARHVQAWKGMLSNRELFFTIRPAGDVSMSDHFLNVLCALPPRERLPDDLGLVSHYLTRQVYGRTTISAAITRLSNAEQLEIELPAAKVHYSLFDRLSVEAEQRPSEEYVASIDAAFSQTFAKLPEGGNAALTFSGGVDSTLLMTYARGSATPITFVPDTPEFAPETRYAREALALLDLQPTEIPIPEARFVEMLETATDTLGTPAFDDATPYFTELMLTQPYDTFIVGQGADSAFGMSLKLARFASWFRGPGIRHAVVKAAPHVPGHLGLRMRQVAPAAAGLAKDPLDPDGYAGNARSFGDTSLFERVVDPSLIRAAKSDQLVFVAERIERSPRPNSAFLSHIELAHWMIVFGNPLFLGQLSAHAAGKRLIGPYLDANTLLELARVPLHERYVRGLRAKWILKELLAERLPGYPINQRKKATALPYERFYEDGPLTNIWDRFEVPDIFVGKNRDELVAAPSTSTWNAITYAIWKQRIADNPTLRPHPAKLTASFEVRVD